MLCRGLGVFWNRYVYCALQMSWCVLGLRLVRLTCSVVIVVCSGVVSGTFNVFCRGLGTLWGRFWYVQCSCPSPGVFFSGVGFRAFSVFCRGPGVFSRRSVDQDLPQTKPKPPQTTLNVQELNPKHTRTSTEHTKRTRTNPRIHQHLDGTY